MIIAGILAGGTGSRMGSAMPKQFLDVCGKPVIVRTVEAFLKTRLFDMIFIAITAGWEDYSEKLFREHFGQNDKIRLITGGTDRTDSILCVMEAAGRYADEVSENSGSVGISAAKTGESDIDDWLLATHDAARPFVSERIIRDNIEAAKRGFCTGTGISAQDTVFTSHDGINIEDIPARNIMFQAQTPQTFRIGAFRKALSMLDAKQRAEVTDVCGVFIRTGMPVCFVKGERTNIKITESLDLALAEVIAGTLSCE